MKKIYGAGFGVRFYRRGVAKAQAREAIEPQPIRKNDGVEVVQDNAYAGVERNQERETDMMEIVEAVEKPILCETQELTTPAVPDQSVKNSARRFTIHPLQELTSPADVMATRGPHENVQSIRLKWDRMIQAAKPANVPKTETLAVPVLETMRPHKTNAREEDRHIALWLAAKNGDCYAIRLLVMDGADLEARDSQGRTALHIATQYGHQAAVKTLLAAKEMRRMARFGELPDSVFFDKFKKVKSVNG